jgi:YHS domain-containing protein
MLKKTVMILLAGLLVMGMGKLSFAGCGCGGSGGQCRQQLAQVFGSNVPVNAESLVVKTEKKTQDVGNKICPVTGEKIDEKSKATYEYQGKIYNFCCPMCIDQFKKDPQKYIKKIEEEKQKEAAEVAAKEKTETKEQGMQEHSK